VTKKRQIIVNIATSADGYIARPDGDIEWLTRRPAPKGFYGMGKFMQSIDTTLFGRKTFDVGLQVHYGVQRRTETARSTNVKPGGRAK
jgi:dihydrofolate reductase